MTAKKIKILIFLIAFFSFPGPSGAQEYEDNSRKQDDVHKEGPESVNTLPPGMEIMKIGGINMLVPQGTQFYMQGSQLKMEEASEYSARRFQDMDKRLQRIEEKQSKMEEEIENLRGHLEHPQAGTPTNSTTP